MLRSLRTPETPPNLPQPNNQSNISTIGGSSAQPNVSALVFSGSGFDKTMADKNPFLKFIFGDTSPTYRAGDVTRLEKDPFSVTDAARNLFR
jgi:hypothetical protein